jgi:hypothetical protein
LHHQFSLIESREEEICSVTEALARILSPHGLRKATVPALQLEMVQLLPDGDAVGTNGEPGTSSTGCGEQVGPLD